MTKEKKSLQKLTDSGQHEAAQHPEGTEVSKQFSGLAEANAFIETYLANPDVPENQKEDLRNQTWEHNHDELTRAIGKLTHEVGRMPTTNDLSNETGLSRQTIHKHMKEFYQSSRYQTRINQFRMLSDRVLAVLYKMAAQGDVRAAKVFLDAVGGLPLAACAPAENINYIQVNNNVKIDQVTFANLPEATQQQILNLFLQGLQSDPAVSGSQQR